MRLKMPRAGDALIAVGLFAIALIGVYTAVGSSDAQRDLPPLSVIALVALLTLPLAWRHRAPRTVLWVAILTWMVFVASGYPNGASIFGLIVALYGIGLYLPHRAALLHGIWGIVAVGAWIAMGVFTRDDVGPVALASTVILLVVALGIGLADNRRHSRLTELEIAHSRQEQARASTAADAVRAERARIARELHDVVAHEVTVMTLQAEGAARIAKDADPRVAEALRTISESGRTGLMEMQRMIGVLRASEAAALDRIDSHAESPTRPGTSADPAAFDLMPMPSLAALPELVQQVADAGLPVSLEVSGSAHVPAGVELSAFRIVQESLTNAMKHAGPGASATVTITREPATITITVEDDGRGVISEAMHSGGHGIDGMRERVATIGGTLDTGPRGGGGYRVQAVLPSGDDQVPARHRHASPTPSPSEDDS